MLTKLIEQVNGATRVRRASRVWGEGLTNQGTVANSMLPSSTRNACKGHLTGVPMKSDDCKRPNENEEETIAYLWGGGGGVAVEAQVGGSTS